MIFAWDEKNHDHILEHGVTPKEAESVVANASTPFPQLMGEEKWLVWGPTKAGRMIQVIFVLKAQHEVEYDALDPLDWATLEQKPGVKITRIIHAMDLTPDMKRQLRRRRK